MKLDNNPLQNKSYDVALAIVKLSRSIMFNLKGFILSKQLLRSRTSVGANIIEANGAISKADFSAKMSIAYKESLETKYWLSLLKDSGDLNQSDFHFLLKKLTRFHRFYFLY